MLYTGGDDGVGGVGDGVWMGFVDGGLGEGGMWLDFEGWSCYKKMSAVCFVYRNRVYLSRFLA